MNLKQQSILGAKWMTLSTGLVSVFAILKISILARFLDKTDFGLMALVTFVLGFMNLFMNMGLPAAILHKQNITNNEYASLYWLNLGFSIFLYIVLILLTPLMAKFYSEKELLVLLPIVGLSLIISGAGQQFKTIEQKELHFKYISLVEISASFLSLIFSIILAVKGFGVYALVYSALLLYTFSNSVYLIHGLKSRGLRIHFSFLEAKPFLKIGIYSTGGQIINYFNKGLDIIIIGKLFGIEVLGGYSLAKQLVLRPKQLFGLILTRVASPTLARLQDDIILLKRNFLKLSNLVATINISIYLIIIVFSSIIVRVFYGSGYENIEILVKILSLYMIFIAVRNPVTSLITATGKTYLDFYWYLFTFPVIPIAILIGAQINIEWVAISMVIAMAVLFIPYWWFIIRKLIPASLFEYMKTLLPNYKRLWNLIQIS